MGYTFSDLLADSSTAQIVIISIITIPLCLIATGLRLLATKRSSRKFGWDDAFSIFALIGFLVYACAPFIGVGVAGDLDDHQLEVLTAKLAYIVTPFFYVNQLFARGSLFIFYYRIFWVDQKFVRWIYGLAAVHVCWFITFFFAVIFLCTPISKWWDVDGTQPGSCLDGNAFLVAEETINSSLDFALIALSVLAIQKLMTRAHMKLKMTFIFTVGGLSGIIGFVKIGIVYRAANTNGQENDTNAFWDLLQMATSIFCACAPMYKALGPVAGAMANAWIRVRSAVSTTVTGRSKSRSNINLSNNFRFSSGKSRSKESSKQPDVVHSSEDNPPSWVRLADIP